MTDAKPTPPAALRVCCAKLPSSSAGEGLLGVHPHPHPSQPLSPSSLHGGGGGDEGVVFMATLEVSLDSISVSRHYPISLSQSGVTQHTSSLNDGTVLA